MHVQELSMSSDETLIQLSAGGDFTAFQNLVARYQSRVFGLAYRIVGRLEDAEDVSQLTFLSLIEHIQSFRGESSAATWILRIASNHALKVLRKKRGLPTVSFDDSGADEDFSSVPHPEFIASWSESAEALAERAEVRQAIDDALHSLDDKYRIVFVLRDIEGLSVRETSESLAISEASVKVRLLRARLMLRELLTRRFGDETTQVIPNHDHV